MKILQTYGQKMASSDCVQCDLRFGLVWGRESKNLCKLLLTNRILLEFFGGLERFRLKIKKELIFDNHFFRFMKTGLIFLLPPHFCPASFCLDTTTHFFFKSRNVRCDGSEGKLSINYFFFTYQ
jgi:hypothetical protein